MNKELNDLVNKLNEMKLVEKAHNEAVVNEAFIDQLKKYKAQAYAYYSSINVVPDGADILNFICDQVEDASGCEVDDLTARGYAQKLGLSLDETKINEETRALQITQILKNKILRMKQKAKDPYWTDNDPVQAAMYTQDARDLEAILAAFLAKNYALVDKLITNLDTAVRDEIPVKLLSYADYTPFNVKTQRGYRA